MIIPNGLGPIERTPMGVDETAAYMQRVLADAGTIASGQQLIQSINILKIPNNMGANKYDSATFVMSAAGGFKAGKLYALKPASGSMDAAFTRNSVAYLRNSSGQLVQVAIDVPRIHWPANLGTPVFLFEPAVINLLLHSEAMDNAYYTKVNLPITPNSGFGPDGLATADLLRPDATNGQHRIDRVVSITPGWHTLSVFGQAAGYEHMSLRFDSLGAVASLSSGITGSISNGITALTRAFANGYFRFVITANLAGSAPTIRINVENALSMAGNYSGNGVNGIRVFGAKLEANRYDTSYNASGASQGTKAVDVLPVSAMQSGVFAVNEGCFLLDLHRLVSNAANTAPMVLRNSAGTELVRFESNEVQNTCRVNLPVIGQTTNYNAGRKIAVAWNGNDVRIAQGGSVVTIPGALGAVDQLRYTGNGVAEINEVLGYNVAPTNDSLLQLIA